MLNRFRNAIYGSVSDANTNNHQASSSSISAPNDDMNIKPQSGAWLRRSLSFQVTNRENVYSKSRLSSRERADVDTFYESIIREEGISKAITKNGNHIIQSRNRTQHAPKEPKYSYTRPKFLQLKTEDEICVSADHQIRPIILPRDLSRLPWDSGYAECINAGKSIWNEDQAACHQDIAIKSSYFEDSSTEFYDTTDCGVPWVYFGMFDGHAGNAVAVAAAEQLHHFIGENLRQVADLLIALEFGIEERDADSTRVDRNDKNLDDILLSMINNYSDDGEEHQDEVEDKLEVDIEKESNEINSDSSDMIEPQNANNEEETSKNIDTTKVEQPEQQQQQQQHRVYVPEPVIETVYENDSSNNGKIELNSLATIKEKNGFKPTQKFNHKEKRKSRPLNRNIQLGIMKGNNITVDSLVIGALESAFWQMDGLIGRDKFIHKMPGGCTAVVSLFILGKLYVCNAGDSRAIVCRSDTVIPMSFDFTPISEKERILRLGLQRPELLGSDFTPLEFLRRPSRQDLGTQMLYKDASMKGWSMKEITEDDLRVPLVWGEGKRSRAMATIGVTRGFGDHELKAQYGPLLIKPFLTPEPEVRVLPLENDDALKDDDVLIMGTDGLWDVTSNEEAAEIVKNSIDLSPCAKYRFMSAAQDLVLHSRGENEKAWVWRKTDDSIASLDDVSVFVIPLKQYRDEYLEWKRLRSFCKGKEET